MKLILPISLVVLLAAAACGGSGEKKIISVEKKIVLKEPVKVVADRELSVDVTGMSCEQGCGGAIRMALKETGAVDRCSFDFEAERETNTAFITFDKDRITAEKIVSIIEKVNDGQFTTANAATRPVDAEKKATVQNREEAAKPGKTSVKDEVGVRSDSVSFEFPNLFELLSRLVA